MNTTTISDNLGVTVFTPSAVPTIAVIVTNQVGIFPLNEQYFVFEVDTELKQVLTSHGLNARLTLESARILAAEILHEIERLATAPIPSDMPLNLVLTKPNDPVNSDDLSFDQWLM